MILLEVLVLDFECGVMRGRLKLRVGKSGKKVRQKEGGVRIVALSGTSHLMHVLKLHFVQDLGAFSCTTIE